MRSKKYSHTYLVVLWWLGLYFVEIPMRSRDEQYTSPDSLMVTVISCRDPSEIKWTIICISCFLYGYGCIVQRSQWDQENSNTHLLVPWWSTQAGSGLLQPWLSGLQHRDQHGLLHLGCWSVLGGAVVVGGVSCVGVGLALSDKLRYVTAFINSTFQSILNSDSFQRVITLCVCVYVCVCMCVCVIVCVHAHMCACVHPCMPVCLHVCMCVCVCQCVWCVWVCVANSREFQIKWDYPRTSFFTGVITSSTGNLNQ